ncbi:MAG: hypothetical protein ACK5EO_13205 [Planctomycetota bacterium]
MGRVGATLVSIGFGAEALIVGLRTTGFFGSIFFLLASTFLVAGVLLGLAKFLGAGALATAGFFGLALELGGFLAGAFLDGVFEATFFATAFLGSVFLGSAFLGEATGFFAFFAGVATVLPVVFEEVVFEEGFAEVFDAVGTVQAPRIDNC